MSESEAVALAQTGDSEALGTLYNLHRQRVFANCLKILRNHEEAEDLTQEVFLKLFKKINQFQGRSSFSTWLHRLTVNCVVHYKRCQKNRPMSNLVVGLDDGEFTPKENFSFPTQHVRLEFFEAVDDMTKLQKFMVEAEISGRSVNGKQPTSHMRKAHQRVREQFA